jgi:hypothetical protein
MEVNLAVELHEDQDEEEDLQFEQPQEREK